MQNKEKSTKRDDQQKFLEDKYKDMKVQIRNLKEGKILRQKQEALKDAGAEFEEEKKELEQKLKKTERELRQQPKQSIHDIKAQEMMKKLKKSIDRRTELKSFSRHQKRPKTTDDEWV